jgi:hypothetical protein
MFTRVLSLRSSTKIVALISLASLFFAVANWRAERAHAATFTSTQSGSWGSAATWGGAGVPGCGDNVTISNGTKVTLDTTRCSSDLTINGTLDIFNNFLEFQGTTFTNNGAVANTTGGQLDFKGIGGSASTTQTIAGTGTWGSAGPTAGVNVINGTTLTPASGTTLDGIVFITVTNGSSLSLSSALIISNASGTTTVNINAGGAIGGAGLLKTQGTITIISSGNLTAPLEVVSGTTTGQGNFGQVTIDNGATMKQNATLTPNGNFLIASGGTLDIFNNFLEFQGTTFTNNGAVANTTGGQLDFKGIGGSASTTQAIAGTGTWGSAGPTAAINVINSTTVDANGAAINGIAGLTIASGSTLKNQGTGSLTLAGGVTNNGTIQFNGGGVACGDATKILIRSSVAGTQRAWSGSGTFSMTDVDVKDQAGSATITATGGVNSGNNGVNWSFTPCALPTPTTQFSAPLFIVGEGDLRVNITVTRTGDTSGASSVGFATIDDAGLTNCNVFNGTASPRCDYENTIGTLSWAAGDASPKTFSVAIVDDSYAEGTETFRVTLSNPTGATLGIQSTASVMIVDNDTTTGPNPIDNTDFFVRQQYLDFLGREPDPPGFAGWTSTINNCSGDTTQCDRIHVSQLFFQSEEFQSRGYFVYRFYPVAFGRKPDYSEFVVDLARVSGFLDANQLEAAKAQFITDFMARTAFVSTYNSLTNQQYVDALLNTAGVTLSSRQSMIDGLNNSTMTRAQVLRQIVESTEVSTKYNHQAYAVMEYFGYLRRQPDSFYLQWIAVLDSTNNPRGMVTGFVTSQEYRNRFGP